MGRGRFLLSVAALLIAMAFVGFGFLISSSFQSEGCRFAPEAGRRLSQATEWLGVAMVGALAAGGLLAGLAMVFKRRLALAAAPRDIVWAGLAAIGSPIVVTTYEAATCHLGATWSKLVVPLALAIFLGAIVRRLFAGLDNP